MRPYSITFSGGNPDTSLLCHLCGLDLQRLQTTHPQAFGQVFENFVATELTKLLASSEEFAELHHFRTSDGKEVDFIIEKRDGKIAGVEANARDTVQDDDFKGLKELRRQVGSDFVCGIVLYSGQHTVAFDHQMWAVPASAMWR